MPAKKAQDRQQQERVPRPGRAIGNRQYHDIDTVSRHQSACERVVHRAQNTREEQRERGEWNGQHEGQVGLQVGPKVNVHHIHIGRHDQQDGAGDATADEYPDTQPAHQLPGRARWIVGTDEVLRYKQVVLAPQQCCQAVSDDKSFEINAGGGWRQSLQDGRCCGNLQHRGNDAQSEVAYCHAASFRRWDRALLDGQCDHDFAPWGGPRVYSRIPPPNAL